MMMQESKFHRWRKSMEIQKKNPKTRKQFSCNIVHPQKWPPLRGEGARVIVTRKGDAFSLGQSSYTNAGKMRYARFF